MGAGGVECEVRTSDAQTLCLGQGSRRKMESSGLQQQIFHDYLRNHVPSPQPQTGRYLSSLRDSEAQELGIERKDGDE